MNDKREIRAIMDTLDELQAAAWGQLRELERLKQQIARLEASLKKVEAVEGGGEGGAAAIPGAGSR